MAGKTRGRRVSKVSLGIVVSTTSAVPLIVTPTTEHRRASRHRIGYTRVFTVAQTLDQQNEALRLPDVIKMYSDTMSGARDDRPGLAELMAYVREGDTVVVWKLDRLGRNTLHILETVKALTDRGVTWCRSPTASTPRQPPGRMMIGVLGSLAEYERELTKERTALKRATSRANGTRFGRPRKVDDASTSRPRSG